MIVHENPGLLDLRGLTVMGMHAKPNSSSPIGHFGTGMKIAIAVIVRHGLPLKIHVGERSYVFDSAETAFRGKDVLMVRYRELKHNALGRLTTPWRELPFTTDLGRHWELWMALRELHANALDEGGSTWASQYDEADVPPREGHTRIVVGGAAYAQVFADIHQVFLPGALRADPAGVQVMPGRRSAVAYYRGLRAMDLPRPSVHTWNFTHDWIGLTEDRTIKHQYYVGYMATRLIMQSADSAFIKSCLTAPDDTWEATFDYSVHDHAATPEFIKMAKAHGRETAKVVVIREYDRAVAREPSRAAKLDWRLKIMAVMRTGDQEALGRVLLEHRGHLRGLLAESLKRDPPEDGEALDAHRAAEEAAGNEVPF